VALIDSCAACAATGQVIDPLRVAVHDVAVDAVAVEESSAAEGAAAPSRVRLLEVN
jgi:hypothetical protein